MAPRKAWTRRSARGLAPLLAAVVAAGCTHYVAKSAASSVLESTRKMQAAAPEEKQISRIVGARAVEGAVEALDQPEERLKIQRIVDDAVSRAVASALRAAL